MYKKEFLNKQKKVKLKNIIIVFAIMLLPTIGFSQDYSYVGKFSGTSDINLGQYSSPAFADIDNDNDLDLYVGEFWGTIKVYINEGNGIFSFQGNLQADGSDIDVDHHVDPIFVDKDGDSDLDLIIGEINGNISFFINDGTGNFSFGGLVEADGVAIDVGVASSPVFADIDDDNDLDLYIGEHDGTLNIFLNDGSGNFSFDGLLEVDGVAIDVGLSCVPVFADIDEDNDLDLYIGEDDGTVNVFINDGNGNFSSGGNLQANTTDIDVGDYSAPAFADIDGDNNLDLYVGEDNGSIKVFINNGGGDFSFDGNLQAENIPITVSESSAPTFADIDGDNDLDLYIGDGYGNVKVYTNNGTDVFLSAGYMQADGSYIAVGYNSTPTFADIDDDNDLDLYIGEHDGNINVFINNGDGSFSSNGNLQADGSSIYVINNSVPIFADIDNDNDLDLFVGSGDGKIKFFTNDGAGVFSLSGYLQTDGSDLDVGDDSAPAIVDIDGDNDLDIYIGHDYGEISIFINNGDGLFLADDEINLWPADFYPKPVFASIGNNCIPNMYVGDYSGIISLYTGSDTTVPTITCVENQVINLTEGQSVYSISGVEFDPVLVADNCEVTSTLNDFNNLLTLGEEELPVGTTMITWRAVDISGNENTCNFQVTINAYVDIKTLQQNGISIHPNPTRGKLNIDFLNDNTQNLIISDVTGKQIIRKNKPQQIETIDLSGLENGVYIISIQTDKRILTTKLIKE